MVSGFAGGLGLSGNDCEMQSGKICGMRFNTLEQHTEYLKKGGCQQLINVLASTMN